jgi:hypothetical protein
MKKFSRGAGCAGDCAGAEFCRGAEEVLQRCRGAEVLSWCRGGSAEVQRCRVAELLQVQGAGAEVQRCRCRVAAVVLSWCRGLAEVGLAQVITVQSGAEVLQRFIRQGGGAGEQVHSRFIFIFIGTEVHRC